MNKVAEVAAAVFRFRQKDREKASITSFVFLLHHGVMCPLLMLVAGILAGENYFGNNIRCLTTTLPEDYLNTFCYTGSTYSAKSSLGKQVGAEVIYAGAGVPKGRDDMRTHSYYMWVAFFFFLQSVCFYAPYYVWKFVEGGRLAMLTRDLLNPIMPDETHAEEAEKIAKYLHLTNGRHTRSALMYYFTNLLNLGNVILQIVATNWFLGDVFTTYGINVVKYISENPQTRTDPLEQAFPTQATCTYYTYSSESQRVIGTDYRCILPHNVTIQRAYVVAWFSWVALTILTAIYMVYATVVLFIPPMREVVLGWNTNNKMTKLVRQALRKATLGNYFLLSQIKHNVDSLVFQRIIETLAGMARRTRPIKTMEDLAEDKGPSTGMLAALKRMTKGKKAKKQASGNENDVEAARPDITITD